MALSAHLNAQAAKFCWPAPEDLSALDLHALLFSTPSSPGSDAVALFASYPPSPQAVEPRGAGPLGPAGELKIIAELLPRLQEAGIESPADRGHLASLLVPGLSAHLLQHLRGGTYSQNEALLTDSDAVAYGRIMFPIGPHIATMLHQHDILSKEQVFLRTLFTAAEDARSTATQAADKAKAEANQAQAEANRLRSDLAAAVEARSTATQATEKAQAEANQAQALANRLRSDLRTTEKAPAEVKRLRSDLAAVLEARKSATQATEKASAEAKRLRSDLTAAEEARRSAIQAAEKAQAEAKRLRSDLTAAEETMKELRRAQEKATVDLATERKEVQRLHVALDIEKEDVEVLHSKYDNLMTVKIMLEERLDDFELSQLNKAHASTQTDSMGEQDAIAQLKFEIAQAERSASAEERRLREQLKTAQEAHKTSEEQRSLLRRECATISAEVGSLRQQAEALGQWSGMSYWPIYSVGLGVHGSVWAAEDLKSSRRVALKRCEAQSDGSMTAAVQRETEALRRVRHDNVVELLDVFCLPAASPPFITLVLPLAAFDLAGIIHGADIPLLPPLIKRYTRQILNALEAIHKAGYIHGDLKPANILVNDQHRVKVADFGMAETMEQPLPRLVLYSRNYRPPEILLRTAKRTSAADIWALGAILAEMIGRRVAFTGACARSTLEAILQHTGCTDPLFPGAHDLPGAFEGSDEASDMQPAPKGITKFAARMRHLPRSLPATFSILEEAALLELRDSCLQVDPALRPAAAELARSSAK
ncbi:serine/threonine protein kinase, CMGC, CDC2/CDK sub [Tilletia horrida]|nr:serine/threonine protein kinase, CMGC, CDC2/CDK sub [Tilletia horrida]